MLNTKESVIINLVKDMAKYLPSHIVPAIVGIVSIPIITRLFSPEEYGNYVLVISTISILTIVANGWISNSIIRFYTAYKLKRKLDNFYSTTIAMMFISIIIVSFIFVIVLFLGRNNISSSLYSLLILSLTVFFVTAFFGILQSFLVAMRQVKWYAIFSIWHNVTKYCFGIVLIIVWHLRIEALLWGSFLSIIIVLPWLWKIAIGKRGILLKQTISLCTALEIAKYGIPLTGGFLATWILSLSDRYILEFFRSSYEVGIYSASYGISERIIFMLNSLFILASTPISMNIWEKQGVKASREFLTKVVRYYILLCLPATVGLSVLAKPITNVMVAQTYYEGFKIIPIIASAAFIGALGNRCIQPIFMWYKKTYIDTVCVVGIASINIMLNFLLVPKYGYIAAALTTFISYSIGFCLGIFISRKFLTWEFPFSALTKIASASALMGIVVYYIGNSLTSSALLNLFISISVGVIVYSIVLFLLGGLQENEIEILLAFTRRRIIKN